MAPGPALYQESGGGDYLQQESPDLLSHFSDFFSTALKKEQCLDQLLLDAPLSPFGAATSLLLSSASPANPSPPTPAQSSPLSLSRTSSGASKDSSRRSSFSTDNGDDL